MGKRIKLMTVLGALSLMLTQSCKNDIESIIDKPKDSKSIDCSPYFFPCTNDTTVYKYTHYEGNKSYIETVFLSCSDYLILEAINNLGDPVWRMKEAISEKGPKLEEVEVFSKGKFIKGEIIDPNNFPLNNHHAVTTKFFLDDDVNPVMFESKLIYHDTAVLNFMGKDIKAIILRKSERQINTRVNQYSISERLLYYGEGIGLMKSEEIINGKSKLISELKAIIHPHQ